MTNLSYYILAIVTCAGIGLIVLSAAEIGLKKQDIICQEGC